MSGEGRPVADDQQAGEEVLDYDAYVAGPEVPPPEAEDVQVVAEQPAAPEVPLDSAAEPTTTAEEPTTTAEPMVVEEPSVIPAADAGPKETAAKPTVPADADDPLAMPPHGTEVFISRIPREATEPQLRAFCEQAGELYEIRVPRDPHSTAAGNKGHAFAVYQTREGAIKALEKLNHTELPDFAGRQVSILMSQVKNRLFLGNIPKELSKEALEAALSAEVRGVTHLELLHDKETNQNRGFGFAEFYNYAAADAARRKLSRDFKLNERLLTVTWAEPRKVDTESEKVKSVYVGSLPETADEAKIREIFSAYGKIESVVVLKSKLDPTKIRDYAFVHFDERASALRAVEEGEADKHNMDGKLLSVHLAKPPSAADTSAYGPGTAGRDRNSRTSSHDQQLPRGRSTYVPGMSARDRPQYSSSGGYGRDAGYGGAPRTGYRAPPAPPPPPRATAPAAAAGGYYEDDQGDEGDDYGGGGYESGAGYAAAYGYGGGMTMVPMMLPTGQMGYVMMAPGAMGGGAAAVSGSGRRAGSSAGMERASSHAHSEGGYDARSRAPASRASRDGGAGYSGRDAGGATYVPPPPPPRSSRGDVGYAGEPRAYGGAGAARSSGGGGTYGRPIERERRYAPY